VVDTNFTKSPEFKGISDKLPMLETAEGCLQETTAIMKYLCQVAGKCLGVDAVERSLVDQWCHYVNTTMGPNLEKVHAGIFGTSEIA